MDNAVLIHSHASMENGDVAEGIPEFSSSRKAIIAVKQSSSDIAEDDGACMCLHMCDGGILLIRRFYALNGSLLLCWRVFYVIFCQRADNFLCRLVLVTRGLLKVAGRGFRVGLRLQGGVAGAV